MIKKEARMAMAFLIPNAPARIPVKAVNITPPMPVETVIMAVAVAFLFPEYFKRVVSTEG